MPSRRRTTTLSMTHLVCGLLLLPLATPAAAGERDRTIRQSPFIQGQYDVFDGGKRVGTVRENPFIDGRYDRYDRDGRRDGSLRENPFVDGEWELDDDPE